MRTLLRYDLQLSMFQLLICAYQFYLVFFLQNSFENQNKLTTFNLPFSTGMKRQGL